MCKSEKEFCKAFNSPWPENDMRRIVPKQNFIACILSRIFVMSDVTRSRGRVKGRRGEDTISRPKTDGDMKRNLRSWEIGKTIQIWWYDSVQ